MGICSTFTKAFVAADYRAMTIEWIEERLNAGVLRGIEDGQTTAKGFLPFDNPARREFAGLTHQMGEYAVFYFTKHRKVVPGSVLKMRVHEEAERRRKEGGYARLSRAQVMEIRQRVAEQLTAQTFPVPSSFPVVWNTTTGAMLIGTASGSSLDDFLAHFEKTFQLYPQYRFHSRWAMALLEDGKLKDRLKAQFPFHEPAALQDGRSLGYEFLTWLWWFGERAPMPIEVAGKGATVQVCDRLVLVCPDRQAERTTCLSSEGGLYEARAAVRRGKALHECRLFVTIGDNEYSLVLDSSLMTLRTLTTPRPSPVSLDSPDASFLEKMFFVEEVQAALDAVFRKFLEERISPTWERSTLTLMREWFTRTEETA